MRLLVTGGAGFIGRAVVRAAIEAGHDVTMLGRGAENAAYSSIVADFLDPDAWRAQIIALQPDACIHLAWCTSPSNYLDSRENLSYMSASLELARSLFDAGCTHLLGAGTCAEYAPSSFPLTEGARVAPSTLYAACKHAFAEVGRELARQANARFTWARLFYVYGPGERTPRVIAAAAQALLDGRTFSASAGLQVRDYLHVHDVASALSHLLQCSPGGVFNVASGHGSTMRAILTMVSDVVGPPGYVHFGSVSPKLWDPPHVVADVARICETGWLPAYTLQTGIEQMVEALRTTPAVAGT